MEYMLLRDGSVKVVPELSNRISVRNELIRSDGIEYYWKENAVDWCCILASTPALSIDNVEVTVDYVDVPDVIKLAAMLE
jgi:hypothetical protein